MEFFHRHCEKYMEQGVSAQQGEANSQFGDLTVKVAHQEGLPA